MSVSLFIATLEQDGGLLSLSLKNCLSKRIEERNSDRKRFEES